MTVEVNLFSSSPPEPLSRPVPTDWALSAPAGGELHAYVWWCGDEDCDCTQARIVHVIERFPGGGWKRSSIVWEGEYHVYGWEDEDEVAPTTELNREAKRLRKHHNELFHRISWPWDRKETR